MAMKERVDLFQSHAGSIEVRDQAIAAVAKQIGFNPTLVRLRFSERFRASDLARLVSIPRWFD